MSAPVRRTRGLLGRRGLPASLILALLFLGRAVAAIALETEADVDLLPTASLTSQGGGVSMQTEATRLVAQVASSGKLSLAEGLGLSGTIWLDADSLPSGSPLVSPGDKVAVSSRVLESALQWEIVPGQLILDAGKRIIHPSSGFFKAPLNLLSRPEVGGVASSSAEAVGKWEEGWVGLDLTWLTGNLSVANFFSPRLTWSNDADQALQYVGQQQAEFNDLVRVGVRIGEADLRLLALTSTRGSGDVSDLGVQTGTGLDLNLGDSLTLRAEASVADSRDRLRTLDASALTSVTESVAWAPRALLGFTWAQGGPRDLSVMAEYYYNGLGFAGSDYSALLQYSRNRLAAPGAPGPDILDQFGSFEAARHYGFVRVAETLDTDLSVALWTEANLQDPSGMTGAVLGFTRDSWALTGSIVDCWGAKDSEAGLSPLLWRLDLEMSLFF